MFPCNILTFNVILQESLQELEHISKKQSLEEDSFDVTPTGELILRDSANGYSPTDGDTSTLKLRGQAFDPSGNFLYYSITEYSCNNVNLILVFEF